MDEKRCEWCGTLSPAEAEKCALCRIPFSAPVPPPQDWSHLTGNIPVITAPLLETPAEAATSAVSEATSAAPVEPVAAPVVPQQVQREAFVAAPVPQVASVPAQEQAPVAAGFAAPAVPAAAEVVPSIGEMATEPARSETPAVEAAPPGWRTPDDPTLRVFADELDQRERRAALTVPNRRGRRRRRQLARLAVWLLAIGLVAAVVVLAPSRLPSF